MSLESTTQKNTPKNISILTNALKNKVMKKEISVRGFAKYRKNLESAPLLENELETPDKNQDISQNMLYSDTVTPNIGGLSRNNQ